MLNHSQLDWLITYLCIQTEFRFLFAGDYPLKDRKLVIAEPDILTFNLAQQKTDFVILASDGLWDALDNESAVNFIRERYNT